MAGGISLRTRAEGREAARAPERSNTQMSSPVWELSRAFRDTTTHLWTSVTFPCLSVAPRKPDSLPCF